jgi:hypothetical protein
MYPQVAFNAKSLLSILSRNAIPCKITFGETEVMYRIQQIGFAYTIASANAHNVFCKAKLLLVIIFKLENLYGFNEKTQGRGLRAKIQGANQVARYR